MAAAQINIPLGYGPTKRKSLGRKRSRSIGYGPSWLQIVSSVKQAIAAKNVGYSQSNTVDINVLGTVVRNVRTDCSGFVSACCIIYGALGNDPRNAASGRLNSDGFVSTTSLKGFTKAAWPGWEKLQAGDIIARSGHVEIFAKNEGGKHYVWNCGSNSSTNNPGVTPSSKPDYTVIFRPNEAGNLESLDTNVSSINSAISGNLDNYNEYNTQNTETQNTQEETDPISQIFNTISNAANSSINTLLTEGFGTASTNNGEETTAAGYGGFRGIKNNTNNMMRHMNRKSTEKAVGFGNGFNKVKTNKSMFNTFIDSDMSNDFDMGKDLNINSYNQKDTVGYGYGEEDVKTKLDVALNTTNVESKLDSLIEVMKAWSDRDANRPDPTSNVNQINNNTNISYANGTKKVTKTSSKTNDVDDTTMKNMMEIHKSIAKR